MAHADARHKEGEDAREEQQLGEAVGAKGKCEQDTQLHVQCAAAMSAAAAVSAAAMSAAAASGNDAVSYATTSASTVTVFGLVLSFSSHPPCSLDQGNSVETQNSHAHA